MPNIFVSLRRGDAQATAVANNIHDRLLRYYRRRHENVDDDIGCNLGASNLRDCVKSKIQQYEVLLVVIGPNWLGTEDKSLLQARNDLVRLEIEEAFDSAVPVIPVLVRGADMPDAEQLPETIRPLASPANAESAVRFTTSDQFDREMLQLYKVIRQRLDSPRTGEANEVPDRLVTIAPSEDRKEELHAKWKRNQPRTGIPPCHDIRIFTLGELIWFIDRIKQSTDLGPGAPTYVDLRGINLSFVHLAGASLARVDLRAGVLHHTDLSEANLEDANLDGADLGYADLTGANLRHARLAEVDLTTAILDRANLEGARLHKASLHGRELTSVGSLEAADLHEADLGEARASGKDLSRASLVGAHLENADLSRAILVEVDLGTGIARARMIGVNLSGADLTGAKIDSYDLLKQATIDQRTKLDFAAWEGVTPRDYHDAKGKARLPGYRDAVRVNHQISKALRDQGLLSLASDYRLREQSMQRRVLWAEHRYPRWLFSWLLNLVAGYGERLGRTVLIYLVLILGFAGAFYGLTQFAIPGERALTPYEAVILSLGSFHGRSLLSSGINLSDPIAAVAASEAIVGLFIELIFIAAFSRRFLGD